MVKILENELFLYSTLKNLDIKIQDGVRECYSTDEINEINAGIAQFLEEESKTNEGKIEMTPQVLESPSNDFKSIIFKQGKDSTQMIALFSIKNFFLESWLSMIGLAIAFFKPPIGITSILQVAKSCWSNFKRLRRPDDNDSIDIIEAILKIKAEKLSQKNQANPTTVEIASRLSAMESSRLENGINKLVGLNAIEVSNWGGERLNLKDRNNQWKIKL